MSKSINKREILRKIFHIVSILTLLIPLEIFGNISITILMTLALIIFYPISKYRIDIPITRLFWKILEFIEREKNMKSLPAKQAFSLAISLIIITILFDEFVVKISIISLAVYDGFATIGGLLFGKTKLINSRTLEGTVIGITANSIALMIFVNPFYAVLISVYVAILEIFSSGDSILSDDNFTLPIGTSIMCWFLIVYSQNFNINI